MTSLLSDLIQPKTDEPKDDRPVDFWVTVALDANSELAWILDKSEDCGAVDLIDGSEASDSGIDMGWTKDRRMGIYKLTLRPWSHQDYDGEVDCGCDVDIVETIFEVPA